MHPLPKSQAIIQIECRNVCPSQAFPPYSQEPCVSSCHPLVARPDAVMHAGERRANPAQTTGHQARQGPHHLSLHHHRQGRQVAAPPRPRRLARLVDVPAAVVITQQCGKPVRSVQGRGQPAVAAARTWSRGRDAPARAIRSPASAPPAASRASRCRPTPPTAPWSFPRKSRSPSSARACRAAC